MFLTRFITFEGIEGSGKTTQIKLAGDYLAEERIPCVVTREPAGTDIGEKIGNVLFNRRHFQMCPETELFLFCAARAQHMREVVRPALEGGKVVLCDRFSDATYAYQGAGRGLDRRFIRQVNDYASQRLKPDLTLLFDLPVEVGLARATKRNDSAEQPSAVDRFEKENLDFHRRIRDGYLALMREDPKRFRLIDASRDVDAVQKDVRRHILAFLKAGH